MKTASELCAEEGVKGLKSYSNGKSNLRFILG